MGLVVVDSVSRRGKVTWSLGPMTEEAAKQHLKMLLTNETRGDHMVVRPATPEEMAIPIPPA